MTNYRRIDAGAIVLTLQRLLKRIDERFPDTGLRYVCADLTAVALAAIERTQAIRRPIAGLRVAVWVLVLLIAALLAYVPFVLRWGKIDSVTSFIEVFEPSLGSIFFVSAFVVSLLSIEARIKRRRALNALHELRAIAHVIDMHQLTKDPVVLLHPGTPTSSSPPRKMTTFELGRYFDYCSEMLSLVSKIAALYIQDFPDQGAMTAVDEIEALTTGLSRKIWQKIIVLRQA